MHYAYVLEWPSQSMCTLSNILLMAMQVQLPFVLDRPASSLVSALSVELLVEYSPMSVNHLQVHLNMLRDGVAPP